MPCLWWGELREFIEVGRQIGTLRRQHLGNCFKGKYWSKNSKERSNWEVMLEGGQGSYYQAVQPLAL